MYIICLNLDFGSMGLNLKGHFVSRFVLSYSAGGHGGAAEVQLDLATAECTLQCFSYIECVLLTWQTTFVQP